MSETLNDYTFYRNSLKRHDGEKVERMAVPMSEPQPGRYRIKRNGAWLPVAIWRDPDCVLRVVVNGELVAADEQEGVWISCCNHAVSEGEYDRMLKGEAGDPVYEKLPENPANLRARVERLAALPITVDSGDDARRLADVAHVLKTIQNTCEARFKEEKAPLDEKIKVLKALWDDPAQTAKAAREPIMAALTRHLKAKNEPGGVKGQAGRAISLRGYSVVEVTDYPAALAHFVGKDPEAFRAVVEKLARAALKAGETPPGVESIKDRRAQ